MFNIAKAFRNLSRSIRTNYHFINNNKLSLRHLVYGQLSNAQAIKMKWNPATPRIYSDYETDYRSIITRLHRFTLQLC